MQANFSEQG